MIRTRKIIDAHGEPVEIEIDDGQPEPRKNFWPDHWTLTKDQVDDIQAGILIRHILAAKDERRDMPPAKLRKRKKQKE